MDGDTRWEVARPKGLRARLPVAREVGTADLLPHVLDVLKSGEAVLITRSDSTPEALREKWEAEFFDLDKAGRKRRRYKKPEIERQWEAWAKEQKKEARASRKLQKDGDRECSDCGAKWYRLTPDYMQHQCGVGLVDIREK